MSERERERERERESKDDKQKLLKSFLDLDQYYQEKNIVKIDYKPSSFGRNWDWQIFYNDTVVIPSRFASLTELPTNIQPTLTSYFVDNHNTSLSRQELGDMISKLQKELNEEKKPTNWTPYILGGIGIVLAIIVIAVVYLLGKNSRKKNNY